MSGTQAQVVFHIFDDGCTIMDLYGKRLYGGKRSYITEGVGVDSLVESAGGVCSTEKWEWDWTVGGYEARFHIRCVEDKLERCFKKALLSGWAYCVMPVWMGVWLHSVASLISLNDWEGKRYGLKGAHFTIEGIRGWLRDAYTLVEGQLEGSDLQYVDVFNKRRVYWREAD